MRTIHILLVEDDESLGYILSEYLSMLGYSVQLATNGEEGLRLFKSSSFDICILDVMMPKKDGFTLASDIRALNETVPIAFLTAKSLKVDKLKGFKIGADDYIVKPVDEEELAARIKAIINRTQRSEISSPKVYTLGKYQFDYKNQQISIGEKYTRITQKEADILKALCDHQGKILDRKDTLRQLWGDSDYFKRRSMDVFISRLRKYLRDDPSISIENVHGRGFILHVDNP